MIEPDKHRSSHPVRRSTTQRRLFVSSNTLVKTMLKSLRAKAAPSSLRARLSGKAACLGFHQTRRLLRQLKFANRSITVSVGRSLRYRPLVGPLPEDWSDR
jgi:hypothetical protein